jgi:formylglycine-generating enzyme required for sulfatase activity
MNPTSILLQAITRDPADALAWFALADALEEKGELESSSLVRETRLLAQEQGDQSRVQTLLRLGTLPVGPVLPGPLGITFRLIPPGSFWMGLSPFTIPQEDSFDPSDETPRHRVTLTRPFWLSEAPIVQSQFSQLMGSNPSRFRPARGRTREQLQHSPVDRVDWWMAQEFCRRLAELGVGQPCRLPTEAEWEYACRAGTTTPYAFGTILDANLANFGDFYRQTTPVKRYLPNAWGLYDMHGNVWEWTADWHSRRYYEQSPEVDPTGPESGEYRVTRGGGWGAGSSRVTSSARGVARPDNQFDCIGFRIVRDWCPDDADLIR